MLSKRLSTMLLSGAAVAGLSAVANAGLLIDVRAFAINGAPLSGPNTPKSITQIAVGQTVGLRVYAQVTGSNANLFQCLQSLSGSFLSGGGASHLLGNMALAAAGQTAPFNSNGQSVGQATDLDGDGDLDIGSNTASDPAGFWAVRAASLTGPHSTDAGGTSVFPTAFQPTAIPGGTEYTLINNLRFVVTSLGSSATQVNFRNRSSNTGGLWAENATEVPTDNGDGTTAFSYTGGMTFTDTSAVPSGLPVNIGVIPEPATFGLAALAGLGMLARRRK
jgi:hypothetical protein